MWQILKIIIKMIFFLFVKKHNLLEAFDTYFSVHVFYKIFLL